MKHHDNMPLQPLRDLVERWRGYVSVTDACDNFVAEPRGRYCLHCRIVEGPHELRRLLNELDALLSASAVEEAEPALSDDDWNEIEAAVRRAPTFAAQAREKQEQLLARIRGRKQVPAVEPSEAQATLDAIAHLVGLPREAGRTTALVEAVKHLRDVANQTTLELVTLQQQVGLRAKEEAGPTRLWCTGCGKSVSTPVPKGTLVRAHIRCPECIGAEAEELAKDASALREALEELRINANRLCDRNLGGTYEDDCRRSIANADVLLRATAETKGQADV